jgi:dolichol-phosphate mannosyltransferase
MVIQNEIDKNPNIRMVLFSRRFGQPVATMAGILLCEGKHCVVIDVDLQDPPGLIVDMYHKLLQGYEVVYAKRRSRKGETWIKRLIAYLGYSLINWLSDVTIPRNTGDFRIMTRRVIEELRKLHESHGFLRGLVAFVGFKQAYVEYDRDERYSGKGNYNRFTGSIRIGLNGLISFSSRPLQLMSILGAFIAGFSFLLGGWYVIQKLFGVPLTPGLSTMVLIVTFFSGIQLLSLGLLGEYIGRIYDEVKRRPLFIIDKVISSSNPEVKKFERLYTETY